MPDTNLRYRLGRIFKNANFEKLLIINTDSMDSNFLYLSGFTQGIFEQSMIIADTSGATLITSDLEYDIAKKQAPKWLEVEKAGSVHELRSKIHGHIGRETAGLDMEFLPCNYLKFLKKYAPGARFVDASKSLAGAREIKDESELEKIRNAVRITKRSIEETAEYFKAGMSEKELKARFEFILSSSGSDKTAFDSIVSFGANTALPHHMPDNSGLKPNEFLLMDVGAKYENYCADITRTFIFKPDKSSEKYKRMVRIYETVQKAQEIGLENLKAGADGSTAHNAVAEFINTAAGGIYKGRFTHSLGHQIGIDVHDGIGPTTTKKTMLENMVVSDEPGIYIYGFGGVRLEDDVIIKKNASKFI